MESVSGGVHVCEWPLSMRCDLELFYTAGCGHESLREVCDVGEAMS